jgi:sugar/nucleoside kinase (ribokinase family)
MAWDVAGLGNALMDALVIVENDALLDELGLVRGTMHPVNLQTWQSVYARVQHLGVTHDSGGSCANTIATVGRLGGEAIYCGQVGDDDMGRQYASLMAQATGAHAIRFAKDVHTGRCLSIISASDAERTMLTEMGAAMSLPNLGDFGPMLDTTKVAHFTGYTLLDGPMQAVAIEAIERASLSGATVSIDVADPFVVDQTRTLLWQLIKQHASLVFLNEEEAKGLTGLPAREAIAEVGRHARTVVVKLGSRGSLVLHDGTLHEIPVRKVKAIDTTGAGDAYAGGFLYACSRGYNAQIAGTLATAVASLAVSQVGAVVRDEEALFAAIQSCTNKL